MNALSNTRRPTDVYRFEAATRRMAWIWLAEQIETLIAKRRARQTARLLASLSDRELSDVGLLRAEIGAAAAKAARA
jgi:uncharacterized protein YjiS (DUF1127 family)